MGSIYRFVCEGCNYAAEVSGGPDIGFIVKTQTVYCHCCRELLDVNVEYWAKRFMSPRDLAQLSENDLGKCPRCRGLESTPWNFGDPCPRCAGKIRKDTLVMDWD